MGQLMTQCAPAKQLTIYRNKKDVIHGKKGTQKSHGRNIEFYRIQRTAHN